MKQPFPVLLVEDDEVDVEAFHRAWSRLDLGNSVHVANDGAGALEWLRARVKDDEPACLIVLDLNLPRMNGLELLQAMQDDSSLAHHRSFVLTTSARPADLAAAYARNACGYFLKEDFDVFMGMIGHYCRINRIP